MRPIPLCLLIHRAMLSDVERDEYGNEQDKAAACLQNVRFEPSTRMVRDAAGTDIQASATLLIDARNSQPAGVTVSVGQSVQWDGRRYLVQDVARLYDENGLHHLEVDLING